jgi:hypothetical protein
MIDEGRAVDIESRDYWFKVVDFLQQNWALCDIRPSAEVTVWFIGDTSGVFDELCFPTAEDAQLALRRNGFSRYVDDQRAQQMFAPPGPPFIRRSHPNGPIYSSGRFWK